MTVENALRCNAGGSEAPLFPPCRWGGSGGIVSPPASSYPSAFQRSAILQLGMLREYHGVHDLKMVGAFVPQWGATIGAAWQAV